CLFPEADKKPPTRKFTLCGTGILPVPRSRQETSHKKIHSLWNRHLACSKRKFIFDFTGVHLPS
ncbi:MULTISPECIES: hypothetical protein, partial [unclassified Microcoleus]|uniref:hypothetical protein n=1 Tax=unclassified Microcoleus TaxID=2642155 RepID=UPI002FD1979D